MKLIKQLSHHRSASYGLIVICLLVAVAITGYFWVPHDPLEINSYNKLIPPFSFHKDNIYLLGTDGHGRDILSRLMKGALLSLGIGFTALFMSLFFGLPLGIIAGYFGGKIDQFICRVVDILLSLPSILLAIVIAAILGPSLENAMIAIGVVNIPHFIRIIRSQVLVEKKKEYVEASKALGMKTWRILYKNIVPNCLAPVIIHGTLLFSGAILEAAALSFVGLGAQAPTPEWGAMLFDGKEYFYNAWWVITFPGLMIFFSVLGFNLLGDGLRDIMDPRLKK